MDPRPFSFRQLHWMAVGRMRSQWDQFGELIALTYNVNRAKHARPITGAHVNPYRTPKAQGVPLMSDNIHMLKGLMHGSPRN